mmetsp:Transcript_32439/g.30933  ORF Transcript_32439/g.30933 Transcript_32439/m.30933 type:complete len:747 (+) Transcript_32439:226-2466(+)
MDDDADVKGGPASIPKPSAKSLDDGYNQTYVIMKNKHDDEKKAEQDNDVFFRCGNWCYMGQIQFNGLKIGTTDLPVLIPTLQKQQGSLRYYCNSMNVPSSSNYSAPLKFLREATEFVADEMSSLAVEKELRKMTTVFPWIDADGAATYFELSMSDVPSYMNDVGLVASKTYTRGLIIISIYSENIFYFVIQSGEGDQPLLDVRFPDVSKHGQGLLLQSYNKSTLPWRKLTLWHILDYDVTQPITRIIPKIRTVNISSANYQQTYCVMKSSFDTSSPTLSVHHDVLFRFGSWCYAGRVQLTPTLTLSDIPFVIPALRMQQGRLDYYCDVCNIPTNSPFAKSLEYLQGIEPLIEKQIYDSEEVLLGLIDRLTKMGLGETVVKWLEGDPNNSFFEFKLLAEEASAANFKGIELVASKCYHPSGVITVTIVFQGTIYVSVLDGDKENPLLDSRFPDVSGKGRGYQLQAYNDGLPAWPELRKVSVWQTVQALEQEFRERAAELAENKFVGTADGGYGGCDALEEASTGTSPRSYQQALLGDEEKVNHGSAFGGVMSNQTLQEVMSTDSGGGGAKEISPKDSKFFEGVPEVAEDKKSRSNSINSKGIEDEILNSNFQRQTTMKDDSSFIGNDMNTDSKEGMSNTSSQAVPISTGAQEVLDETPGSSGASLGANGLGSMGPRGGGLNSLSSIAKPHHIPRLNDSLAKRMDEIRKTMTDGAIEAPWDKKGRPLKNNLNKNVLSSPGDNDNFSKK